MPSDEELMGRVRERDGRAFDTLFARHAASVRRQLVRILRDEAAAEDLLQEAFLRLWTRGHQWDGRGALRSWLGRVATNLALNHLRSVKRRRHRPLELPRAASDEEEELAAPGWMVDAAALPPDEPLLLAEEQELLARLINALPEGKRQVVRLLGQGEIDLAAVAETLGIPEGTVKSRLHYALKALARAWRQSSTD